MKLFYLNIVVLLLFSFSLQNELKYLDEHENRNLQARLISNAPSELLTIEATILTSVKSVDSKIGTCNLNFSEIKDGFTRPDSKIVLSSYDPDHREIRLFNCKFSKKTPSFLIDNKEYFSINFRNLSNKGKINLDLLLGASLTYIYTDENQSYDIVFLFGNCKGKTSTKGKENTKVSKQELDTLKGYFDDLSIRHKTYLRNEINKGIAKLKEFETFDKMNMNIQGDSEAIKKQFADLEDIIAKKNQEYQRLSSDLDNVNKAIATENQNLESKKVEKRAIESEINTLNAKKTTLEKQQIEDNQNIAKVNASWNLYNGGYDSAQTQIYKTKYLSASSILSKTKLDIKLQYENAKSNLQVAIDNLETSKLALLQAEENYSIEKNRFAEGIATSTDLTDANYLLTQAKQGYNRAYFDKYLAISTLDRIFEKEL